MKKPRVCPECGYEFHRGTLAGIDFHWRRNHNDVMRYENARLLILTGKYKRRK